VTSDDEGRLTLTQSSPTATARLYSQADVLGKRTVPINWLFANSTGDGVYVANSTSWPQAWAAVNIQEALPVGGDASAIIGLPYRRLDFSPSSQTQRTDPIDLARRKVLHLCSRDLPQTSLTAHGRTDVVASILCAGSSPGSLIHNGYLSPANIYCANTLQLRQLAFQVRTQSDEIVDLSGHSISFDLGITRPYEYK
jgi:hypothetical protein